MSWWPFKRKADPHDPEDEMDEVVTITATPYAGRVSEMIAAGWSGDQIVAVLQMLEVERVTTEARVRAQMSAAMATKLEADKLRVTTPRNRVTKSRVTSVTTKAKRSRAQYMRTYRARRGLRLVTRDGVVADDTRDGGAA
jgi:hypothetical protein